MPVLWTAAEMCAATGGAMTQAFDAQGVSIDTRSLQPGDVFVALVGENGDGHAFVPQAMAAGAAGALVAGALVHENVPQAVPCLKVADTLHGLQDLGRAARARFQGKAVAVTGSVGKTTTKEMLRAILSAFGATHAAQASYNNHWGVPLTLARLPRQADFLVSEIGMNHPGEIAPLARMVRPDVAVIVSVEAAHIGHMGSLEAIADEKAAILTGLTPGHGVAVLPADHPLLSRLKPKADSGLRVLSFGVDPQANACLLDWQGAADSSHVHARIAGQELRFHVGAPGRHMVMNALAALLAAVALGLDPAQAVRPLAEFRPTAGRGARRPVLDGAAILLDESYNASGASVRAALQVLRITPARRHVAVLGDMRELGAFGPAEHAALAPQAALCADIVHCCGPLMRHLYEALPPEKRGIHSPDAQTLAPDVAADLRAGDVVLVKGSLGSRMRFVVQALENVSAGGDA